MYVGGLDIGTTGCKVVLFDENGTESIQTTSIKPHGNIVIAEFKGIGSIEEAEKYRNRVLYINRRDVKLEKGRYFIDDLIGCMVFDIESGDELGEIAYVSQTGADDVWHIKSG